jgi:hypothetical protein
MSMGLAKELFRVVAVVCACALITGCGDVLSTISRGGSGGDKSSSIGTSGPAAGSISGVAMGGQLTGGSARIFNFDSGRKGEMLAEGPVDAQGKFRIDLKVRSQPVLIEISGGRYIEPSSGRSITLSDGQVLVAVQNYRSGSAFTVSPTYYTTLAAGLAENLVRMGSAAAQAVVDANQRIPAITGLASGFDAVAATAVDVSNPASVTPFVTTELEYGFASAALSSLTESASITASRPIHETINSIALAQLALDDVRRDGVLDGQGRQGVLAIGVTPLSADVYRNNLALNILRMASNTQGNRTSISPAQILPLAQRLNNSTDPIYGGKPIIPLNVDAPMVADVSIASNALLAGEITVTATATSLFGITSVELLVDGIVVGTAMDPAKPAITFDTTAVADGSRQFSVRATDVIGGRTTTPATTVSVINAQGSISNVSLANNSVVRGTIAVMADIVDGAGIAQVRYFVDNFQPVVSTDPRAPFQLDTVGLRLADNLGHTFRIAATNNLGRELMSPTVSFRVDNQAPNVVIASPTPGAFLRQQFTLAASATDNNPLGRLELSIDAEHRPDITRVQDGFLINTLNFQEGDHVLAVRAQDEAANDAVATVPVVFDNTPPTVMVTSPAQNAAIRGAFDVVATLSDNLALGAIATTFLDPSVLDLNRLLDLGGGVDRAVLQTSPMQGTLTQPVDGTVIPADGPHTYVVVVRDQAGNASISAPVNVSIDNTSPVLSISIAENRAPQEDQTNFPCILSGTIADASPIAEATVESVVLGGAMTGILSVPTFTLGAFPASTFSINVTDSVGNVASAQIRVTIQGGFGGGGQAPREPDFVCMFTRM